MPYEATLEEPVEDPQTAEVVAAEAQLAGQPIEEPAEELAIVEETDDEGESDGGQQVANIEPAAGDDMAAIAEQLQDIEPAAGPSAGGNSGYGFNSSPVEVSFAAPPASCAQLAKTVRVVESK